MKNLILTLIITLPLTIWGQGWEQTFGGGGDDNGNSIQQTFDGGYITTGYTNSFGNGNNDVYLIKIDENGNEQWSQTFGGEDDDWGNSVQQTSDGGYIVIGNTFSFGSGSNSDILLIKTDENGIELWSQTYGGEEDDYGKFVQETLDGGYIMSFNSGVLKTDSLGNVLWELVDVNIGHNIQLTSDTTYVYVSGGGLKK